MASIPVRAAGWRARVSLRFLIATLFLLPTLAAYAADPPRLTDEQIRSRIIAESISSYPGNCPCPWNTDRAGRRCGKRSAYDRPGGYSPKCYAHDITDAEVSAYRKRARTST
jgi:hypothetical protein